MQTKFLSVALVGNSNVGKSTLLNRLVGQKISIVTHKVQTTRSPIRAIFVQDKIQIIFVDTPGIFKPKRVLERRIVKNAWSAFGSADIFCVVVDPRYKINDSLKDIIKKCNNQAILVINKIDLIKKYKLLEIASQLNAIHNFSHTFMISALDGSGVRDLKNFLLSSAKEGDWYFEGDVQTDMPIEFLLAEICREKLFLRVHKELPYSLTVETEKIEETFNKLKVQQVIYVKSHSHKSIILGVNGATIKNIRIAAAKEMESLLKKKVDLFLFVKVRKFWQEDDQVMKTISY
jgi:GTP-binding protein Era